jgi:hypothetical protein
VRVHIVSESGYGVGIALRLSSEGHAVNFQISSNHANGSGLISGPGTAMPDVVIYDSDLFGREADLRRQEGMKVLGTSHWSQTMADDPGYADKVIQLAGWNRAESPDGINLYLTFWFNGVNFVASYASLVYRRFMAGGHGKDVEFAGAVADFSGLTRQTIEAFQLPLERVLRRTNHRGCVHVHAIINERSYGVRSLSASFNHPLALLYFENSRGTITENLLKLLDESSKPTEPIEPWAAGILISAPPFPYNLPLEPTLVNGIAPGNLKHLWLVDIQKEGEQWKTTGSGGIVGYVTSRGTSVSEATRRAYRTLSNLYIENMQYRDDIGKNVQDLIVTLNKNGWLKGDYYGNNHMGSNALAGNHTGVPGNNRGSVYHSEAHTHS